MTKSTFKHHVEAAPKAERRANEGPSDRHSDRASTSVRNVPKVYRQNGKIESFGALLEQVRKQPD